MWFCLDMKSAERQMRWPSRWRRRRGWSVEGGIRQRGTFLIEGPPSLSLSISPLETSATPSLLVREINRRLPNHTLPSVYLNATHFNAAHLLGGAIISTLAGALLNCAILHLPEVMTVCKLTLLLLFLQRNANRQYWWHLIPHSSTAWRQRLNNICHHSKTTLASTLMPLRHLLFHT